ncbi:hypothetical protein D4764_11G0008290 [Takifugu flavidus]|uniref:Uncharacterized protein n=1 Tax=Takifugu flavidus TaxID=433684 RepID=A0A5C6PJ28_9TELE|nr:hypothetical protein D4764_11G0008290 [Takifugu flavidus]
MQFCRRVLCQPCSARVTSPEEDMEYKMGSCMGISHRQDRKLWILHYNGPTPPAVHTSVRAGDLPTTLVPLSRVHPLSCPATERAAQK